MENFGNTAVPLLLWKLWGGILVWGVWKRLRSHPLSLPDGSFLHWLDCHFENTVTNSTEKKFLISNLSPNFFFSFVVFFGSISIDRLFLIFRYIAHREIVFIFPSSVVKWNYVGIDVAQLGMHTVLTEPSQQFPPGSSLKIRCQTSVMLCKTFKRV